MIVGIAAAALLLMIAAAIVILVRRGRRSDSETSSLPAEMAADSLDETEDINFSTTTLDTNPVEHLPTDLNLIDPGESSAFVMNIIDDFL
jgi:hypothetical protein